jgi:predicted ATPase
MKQAKNNGNDLKIKIKNFGPITRGEINIKPLTLFIGPNGSGKSYIAMLIQALFESYSKSSEKMPLYLIDFIEKCKNNDDFIDALLEKESETDALANFKDTKKFPEELMKHIMEKISEVLHGERLSNEISFSFGSSLEDLVQIGKDHFEIKCMFGTYSANISFKEGKLQLTDHPTLNIRLNDLSKNVLLEWFEKFENKQRFKSVPDDSMRWLEIILSSMLLFEADLSSKLSKSCYYLPASRSGLFQVYKELFLASFKAQFQRTAQESEKTEGSKLSGAVVSFVTNLCNMPAEKGPLYDIACDFERMLIKGEIHLKRETDKKGLFPEIRYTYQNTNVPLHRVSSTVSELAPIILYIKHLVKPGTILIIEEPEAHLHPANQLIMAQFLVRLVREGVKLIITTHSDYLLQRLNNFILLNGIESEIRQKRYNHLARDFLKADEISPYIFEKITENTYKINKIRISEEEGISQEEFGKVMENLYDETIKIREDVFCNYSRN